MDKLELKYLVPGLFQGITRTYISYPFEVIKTQMQIKNKGFNNTLKDIIKNDSKKLFRGISVPLTSIPLERSLQFYIYEKTKKNNSIFFNSFLTSLITNTIFTPLSILNVKIINTNKSDYKNLFTLIKENKIKNLFYKGISLEITKNYISTFSYFYIYSSLKENLKINNFYYKSFISGVCSSIGVWLIVLPLDTVKLNYQVGNISFKNFDYLKSFKFTNYWKGLTPIIIRTCPSAGLGMLVYEYVKNKVI